MKNGQPRLRWTEFAVEAIIRVLGFSSIGFVALIFLFLSQYSAPTFWENIPGDHWRFPVSKTFGWHQVLVFYPLIIGLP